jgi:hypothetical protein
MALTLHGIEFLLILELDPDPLAAPDYRRTVQPLHRCPGLDDSLGEIAFFLAGERLAEATRLSVGRGYKGGQMD